MNDGVNGLDNLTDVVVVAEPKPAARKAAAPKEKRITIVVEDNDSMPPGGLFLSVNGKGYLLQAGVEVPVPEPVLDVLNHAIESVPVRSKDGFNTVIGYKDRLRFPYRIIPTAQRS